jgi:hypothetical protein
MSFVVEAIGWRTPQRPLDGEDWHRQIGGFLASSFLCFQALSTRTPPPVTPTVRRLLKVVYAIYKMAFCS